jgi:1,4-alpha-glucan branching enzyme
VAAAVIVSVVAIDLLRATRHIEANPEHAAAVPIPATTVSASGKSVEAAPIPTQFVFDGKAQHVFLVGDFNNWDEHVAPLEREPGSTLWSVTVPLMRGRHVYAFLVDSVWTIDKRAPVARDPDFGVTGSVVLVGRP